MNERFFPAVVGGPAAALPAAAAAAAAHGEAVDRPVS